MPAKRTQICSSVVKRIALEGEDRGIRQLKSSQITKRSKQTNFRVSFFLRLESYRQKWVILRFSSWIFSTGNAFSNFSQLTLFSFPVATPLKIGAGLNMWRNPRKSHFDSLCIFLSRINFLHLRCEIRILKEGISYLISAVSKIWEGTGNRLSNTPLLRQFVRYLSVRQ